jgi:non-specific serine/threonine protein kinase/serine/threonine-protein kinase
MEYVDGTPIDVYCDQHALGVQDRLRLFVEVCRAVQYAHDRLIVHRDIKASNVIVGADGRPRLLDFGIAKLLASDDRPADPGATLVQAWTPESASPEQVRGEQTTIATDVYGLGALLFRLLTGRAVFDLSGCDTVERARLICEVMPERPSLLARSEGGTSARKIAADLDAIVLKALHKEPARRYRSAEHLAEDVERHVAHRPVLAAPDSWAYRIRKFVARHPVAATASTVAVLAVLAATAAALWQARRADAERDRAQARLTDVRRLANAMIFDVYDRVENSPGATSIRRSLVQQGLAYLDQLSADAGAAAQLSVELAEAYARLARVQGVRGRANLGDQDGAIASLEKARGLLAPLRTTTVVPVEIELADLRMARDLASILVDRARAHSLTEESVRRSEALRARYPDRADVLESLANAYFFAALSATGDDVLRFWADANRAFGGLVALSPGDATHLRNLALTEKYIGSEHHTAGRLDVALPHYERALALDRQVEKLRPNDRQTTIDLAFDLGNVAGIVAASVPPDLPRAAALYRESLARRERASSQDPQDVFARQAVGFCLMQLSLLTLRLGDVDAALEYGRRSVDVYESLPEAGHLARRGFAWLAFGQATSRAGRRTQGCDALRRAHAYYNRATERERQASSAPDWSEVLRTCEPS